MSKTAMQLAFEVAQGKLAQGDLSPRAKKRVQYILDCYGPSVVKDLANYKDTPAKIGHRVSMSRKVSVR